MSKENFTKGLDFLKEEDINDYAIDFLVHSIDSSWKVRDNNIKYPIRYAMLKDIINSKGTTQIVKGHLDRWYKLHEDSAWYDSHKSKENIYTGYWSYEAGAIVKILNLNDEELKQQQYYPYDLVHFNG
ncbi:MAG: PoNe immunity protein domain-containing protein [Breznakia sp.]